MPVSPEHPAADDAAPPAAFLRLDQDRFAAQETAAGPWSDSFCHGGAPAALILQWLSSLPTRSPMAVARLTLSLTRPVPVGVLSLAARVVHEGRSLQQVEVTVSSEGVPVTRSEVLRVRITDQDEIADVACNLPSPATAEVTRPPAPGGFSRLFEMRAVRGRFEQPGPAAVWFRMLGSLVEGEPTDPAARLAAFFHAHV